MTEEKKPVEPAAVGGSDSGSAPDESRRRLAKAALASPVIMTFASRPVWGAACTASALGSMTHTSHHPDENPATCVLGCTSAYWVGHSAAWDALTGYNAGDSFINVFSLSATGDLCGAIGSNAFEARIRSASLLTVLSSGLAPANARQTAVANAAKAAVLGLLNSAAIEKLKVGADPTVSVSWNPYPLPTAVITSFGAAFSQTFCLTGGGPQAQSALNTWTEGMNDRLIGATCPFPA
jgi:hypothetical protein